MAESSMQSRWERTGVPLMQWVAVPLSVFAFCYLVVGPRFSAPQHASGPAAQANQPSAKSNDLPIQPGKRKWIPVSPPQASVNITRTEVQGDVPTQNGLDGTTPPDQAPPDGSTVDEGSTGAMAPPVKKSEGGDPKKPDEKGGEKTEGGAFKGIGH